MPRREEALVATDLQRQSMIRTTDLTPEAVIPPPSTRRIAWGPLIVGLLILVTAGVALAWSLGLAGLSDEVPVIRDASVALPAATPPRSPYPTELPDLSGREARSSSVRRAAPLTPPPPALSQQATATIVPAPVAVPAPNPLPAPRGERIRTMPAAPGAVTPRTIVSPRPQASAAPRPKPQAKITVDVPARNAQPLGGPLAGVFVPSDYPAAARSNGERGDVTVRLAVSRDGRVSGCRILAADASPTLVAATCAILTQRGRFVPAVDPSGAATAGFFVQHVAWRLP